MAFFGLGSFSTGLVTGLAESANEALKKDISRINTKIDKISQFRVERAIKEQEERKAELEDITEALKEGEALFGDHPRASEFAASMLQDAGSLDAYRAEIKQLRTEQRDKPQNLANFFELEETNNPIGNTIDYARAYQGAPKTLPDYRLPEGMTGEDKSLLGKLGFDIDISGRVKGQTEEVLSAAGVTTEQPTTFTLPSLKFKREDYNISRMSASERLTFLNNERANPNNTPERNAQLDTKIDDALTFASQTKDIDTQIDANKQILDRMSVDDKDYNPTLKIIIDLTDKRDLREAKLKGSIEDEFAVRIRQAMRENNPEKAAELRRELNKKLGTGETLPQEVARLEAELMSQISDGRIARDSEEFRAAQSVINNKKIIIRDQQLDNVTVRDFNAAEKLIEDAVDDELVRQLGLLPDTWKEIKLKAEGPGGIESLSDAQREVYDKAVNLMGSVEQTILSSYEEAFKFDPSMIKAINTRRGGAAYAPESTGSKGGALTSENVETTQDSEAAKQEEAFFPPSPEARAVDIKASEDIKSKIPMNSQGANKIISLINKEGGTVEDIYNSAFELYGEDFAAAAEYMAEKKGSGMSALEREIASLSIDGMNVNEITAYLKQSKYKDDPSFDVQSISSTVSRVLANITPEARQNRVDNARRAAEYEEKRQQKVKEGKLGPKLGLMSR
jgi:hypothetical protein